MSIRRKVTVPYEPPVTNTYHLTMKQVVAIKDLLLLSRSEQFKGYTGLTDDECVELECLLLWYEPK